jgi:hypothetical protein
MPFWISVVIDNKESEAFEWKTVPRVGESVELGDDLGFAQVYEVIDVAHMFRRGMEALEGEICLFLKAKEYEA